MEPRQPRPVERGRARRVGLLLALLTGGAVLADPTPLAAQIARGQVVDSVTGDPLAGGRVLLVDAGGRVAGRTVTDPDGLFLVRGTTAGRYRLRVEAEGYRASEFPPFDLGSDQVRAYVLLVAPVAPAGDAAGEVDAAIARVCPEGAPRDHPVLVGLVTDAVTGEPVPDAEVRLSWSTVPEILRVRVDLDDAEGSAVSGASGFYAVCGAPLGTRLLLHAMAGDRLSEIVALEFDDGGVHRNGRFARMATSLWRQDLTLLPPERRAATVTGVVTDGAGALLAGAAVRVAGTDIQTLTNSRGAFRLEALPPGHVEIEVERAGYQSAQHRLTLAAADTVTLPRDLFQLPPQVAMLPPVTVEGRASPTRRDLSDFWRRRESTPGSFITREEFEKAGNVQRTTDVLRRMRGLNIRPGYGHLDWLITTRRGSSRGSMGAECFPLVFMDRVYIGTTASLNVDQQIPVVNIEAVEVHASATGLPPEFNRRGSTCGVIVFWTR